MKSIGPRTLPCGMPEITSLHPDSSPSTMAFCVRFERKLRIQPNIFP